MIGLIKAWDGDTSTKQVMESCDHQSIGPRDGASVTIYRSSGLFEMHLRRIQQHWHLLERNAILQLLLDLSLEPLLSRTSPERQAEREEQRRGDQGDCERRDQRDRERKLIDRSVWTYSQDTDIAWLAFRFPARMEEGTGLAHSSQARV